MEYTQIIHNDLMNKKLYCHSTTWEGNYGDMAINVALKQQLHIFVRPLPPKVSVTG